MFQSSAIPPPLASPGLSAGPITPAAPPSRSEIERKLSFKSAAPRDLPKKKVHYPILFHPILFHMYIEC
jgi:hypothetical protein